MLLLSVCASQTDSKRNFVLRGNALISFSVRSFPWVVTVYGEKKKRMFLGELREEWLFGVGRKNVQQFFICGHEKNITVLILFCYLE